MTSESDGRLISPVMASHELPQEQPEFVACQAIPRVSIARLGWHHLEWHTPRRGTRTEWPSTGSSWAARSEDGRSALTGGDAYDQEVWRIRSQSWFAFACYNCVMKETQTGPGRNGLHEPLLTLPCYRRRGSCGRAAGTLGRRASIQPRTARLTNLAACACSVREPLGTSLARTARIVAPGMGGEHCAEGPECMDVPLPPGRCGAGPGFGGSTVRSWTPGTRLRSTRSNWSWTLAQKQLFSITAGPDRSPGLEASNSRGSLTGKTSALRCKDGWIPCGGGRRGDWRAGDPFFLPKRAN